MVDFLFRLGVPAFKISSGDISYKQLIQKAGLTRLPVILSTGMARPEEIKKAVRWLKNVHCRKMAILHCVAVYPPKWEDLHLRYIPSLKKTFHCPAGFSDHTADDAASLAAVALGADIIEKHFTLANDMPGPDHKLSLDPAAFSAMVRKVRAVEQSLGSIRKKLGRDELKCLETGRRSLKARAPVPAGTVVSPENTILIKPTKGIAPEEAEKAYGRRAKRAIAEGETIEWKDLEKKR
jgi:sialic acid synthase SpsE